MDSFEQLGIGAKDHAVNEEAFPPRTERGKAPVLEHPEGWRSDGIMVSGSKI